MLDAVGPLCFILEEARKGQLPPKATVEAAQTALCLLGNASANISRERRRAALTNMNSRLVDMAEDDHPFAKAAPNLFGDGFAKKAKEREGHSEPYQRGSEYVGQECDIKSLPKTRFPIPTLHGSEKRWG